MEIGRWAEAGISRGFGTAGAKGKAQLEKPQEGQEIANPGVGLAWGQRATPAEAGVDDQLTAKADQHKSIFMLISQYQEAICRLTKEDLTAIWALIILSH